MVDQALKICAACQTTKTRDQFEKRPDGINGLRAQCRQCQRQRRKKRQSNRPRQQYVACSEKICSSCQKLKPATRFRKCARSSDGLRSRCKDCQKLQEREYRQVNRNRLREKSSSKKANPVSARARQLRFHYRMEPMEYERPYTLQNGLCAICGRPQISKRKFLAIDHDHATGTVRGLLCFGCNIALGHFQEDLTLLEKAAVYLRRFNTSVQENPNIGL